MMHEDQHDAQTQRPNTRSSTRRQSPRARRQSLPTQPAATEDERIHEAYVQLGHLGGAATKEKHGPDFYSEIGQKGGEARKGELGHEGYQQMGYRGGSATRNKYGAEFYSEIGQKGGEARRAQMARGQLTRSAAPESSERQDH